MKRIEVFDLRFVIIVLLACVFKLEISFPQETVSKNKNAHLIDHNILINNIHRSPFQFGLDIGVSIPSSRTDNYSKFGILGYMDVNIYDRVIYFKIEAGGNKLNNFENVFSSYVSVGLNGRILNIEKSRVFLHAGISSSSNSKIRAEEKFSLVSSLKYVYVLNELLGLTAGVKILYSGSYNPFFTVGVNLVNN